MDESPDAAEEEDVTADVADGAPAPPVSVKAMGETGQAAGLFSSPLLIIFLLCFRGGSEKLSAPIVDVAVSMGTEEEEEVLSSLDLFPLLPSIPLEAKDAAAAAAAAAAEETLLGDVDPERTVLARA